MMRILDCDSNSRSWSNHTLEAKFVSLLHMTYLSVILSLFLRFNILQILYEKKIISINFYWYIINFEFNKTTSDNSYFGIYKICTNNVKKIYIII